MAKRVLTIIEINNFFNFVKFKPREASNNLGFIGPDSSQKEHPVESNCSLNPRYNLGFPDETFNMFVGCKNVFNTH
jgi:hypothetical protein